MKFKIIISVIASLLFVGCGSDTANNEKSYDLNGTWYYKTTNGADVKYVGQHVIKDYGDYILITDCLRNQTELTKSGTNLFYKAGNHYYRSIFSSEILVGPNDSGGISEVIKLDEINYFNSGTLNYYSDNNGNLLETSDVCSTAMDLRYGLQNYSELLGKNIIISAQFSFSSLTIEIGIRDIVVGNYVVTNDPYLFLSDKNFITAEITSPEFSKYYGQDRLFMKTGSVSINKVDNNFIDISGNLIGFDGGNNHFSAQVKLNP